MADIPGVLSSSDQMKANYEKYRNKYKDSTDELVNSETFLNLMVAEMTNQDPLEPTSNTDFIAQLAQFTQLTYAQDSSKFAMANYAATLVGKVATGSKMDGTELVTKTGVVESVTSTNNSYTVRIDGVDFDIKKITAVKDKDTADASGVTSNGLADSIARAANMVGMYATVNVGDKDTKSGFIDSIKVKDGKITAVITDPEGKWSIESPLDKITEVTYATIVEEPDESEKGDAANDKEVDDDKENDEKVDGVDSEEDKTTDKADNTNKAANTNKLDNGSVNGNPESNSDVDVKNNLFVEDDDPSNTNFG
ncbi:MAG: hypothetical protein HDT43_11565 [Ruminococcaceae bacterium]|nr:hypothetical protein [Oscillospiraceae bacterium]